VSRETFHASLTDDGKLFFKELAVKLGPLKYEGDQAPKGYVVTGYQPHRVRNDSC